MASVNTREVISKAKSNGWGKTTTVNMNVYGMDIQAEVSPQSIHAFITLKNETPAGGIEYARGSVEYFFDNGKTRFGDKVKGCVAVYIGNINSYESDIAFIVSAKFKATKYDKPVKRTGKVSTMFSDMFSNFAIKMAVYFLSGQYTVVTE